MSDNFSQLQQFWGANFNYKLTEANGSGVWAAFVNSQYCDFELFLAAVEKYAETYGRERERGMHPQVPTFQQVKARYFAMKKARELQRTQARYGAKSSTCGICFGRPYVVVLAAKPGDEERRTWPADYRHIPDDQYPGVEVTPCPVCMAEWYKDPYTRNRVEERCLPDQVGPAHPVRERLPGWMQGAVVTGKAVLEELLKRKFAHAEDLDKEFPA